MPAASSASAHPTRVSFEGASTSTKPSGVPVPAAGFSFSALHAAASEASHTNDHASFGGTVTALEGHIPHFVGALKKGCQTDTSTKPMCAQGSAAHFSFGGAASSAASEAANNEHASSGAGSKFGGTATNCESNRALSSKVSEDSHGGGGAMSE